MSLWGKTIHTDYQFVTFDPKHIWNWGDKKVGEGAEIDYGETNGIFAIDFRDKDINITFKDTGLFTRYAPNGPVFTDDYDVLNPITGFKLKTNMHGLTKSDITFDQNGLEIDWNGASFTRDTYVSITLTFKYKDFVGTKGKDVLTGTKYDDFLLGKKGADIMTGGKGADHFIFATGDSGATKATADYIKDFKMAEFDILDFSRWDGNENKVGTQDFTFVGTKKFSKTVGELRYEKVGSETHVTGDTDGDGKADFLIRLAGKIDLTKDFLIL